MAKGPQVSDRLSDRPATATNVAGTKFDRASMEQVRPGAPQIARDRTTFNRGIKGVDKPLAGGLLGGL
jgi:hypothetical protein